MDAITRGSARRAGAARPKLILLLVACAALTTAAACELRPDPVDRAVRQIDDDDLVGLDLGTPPSSRPTVEAAFRLESYRPGDTARLAFFSTARRAVMQVVRAGTEHKGVHGNDTMAGSAVTTRHRLGRVRPGDERDIRIGNWLSGLYFARVQAAGGRVGYAPFVLRPTRLGEHRVAVVLPTLTWQ